MSPLPRRRKSDNLDHACRFEDYIIEMHGDIKEVIAQVKIMNGSVKSINDMAIKNKEKLNKHSIYWGLVIFIATIFSAAYIKSLF